MRATTLFGRFVCICMDGALVGDVEVIENTAVAQEQDEIGDK
jgi:hypothetical protein